MSSFFVLWFLIGTLYLCYELIHQMSVIQLSIPCKNSQKKAGRTLLLISRLISKPKPL